jgi:hypothetical protein
MDVRNLNGLKIDTLLAQYNALRADTALGALKLRLHTAAVPSSLTAIDEGDLTASTNALVTAYEAHRVSAFVPATNLGAHASADSTNVVAAAVATNLATSLTRANELKGDLNAHIAVTAKHIVASSAAVAAADATDAPTLLVLLTDIYDVLLAHAVTSAWSSEGITVIDA